MRAKPPACLVTRAVEAGSLLEEGECRVIENGSWLVDS